LKSQRRKQIARPKPVIANSLFGSGNIITPPKMDSTIGHSARPLEPHCLGNVAPPPRTLCRLSKHTGPQELADMAACTRSLHLALMGDGRLPVMLIARARAVACWNTLRRLHSTVFLVGLSAYCRDRCASLFLICTRNRPQSLVRIGTSPLTH
jgi:hypothetical protein